MPIICFSSRLPPVPFPPLAAAPSEPAPLHLTFDCTGKSCEFSLKLPKTRQTQSEYLPIWIHLVSLNARQKLLLAGGCFDLSGHARLAQMHPEVDTPFSLLSAELDSVLEGGGQVKPNIFLRIIDTSHFRPEAFWRGARLCDGKEDSLKTKVIFFYRQSEEHKDSKKQSICVQTEGDHFGLNTSPLEKAMEEERSGMQVEEVFQYHPFEKRREEECKTKKSKVKIAKNEKKEATNNIRCDRGRVNRGSYERLKRSIDFSQAALAISKLASNVCAPQLKAIPDPQKREGSRRRPKACFICNP